MSANLENAILEKVRVLPDEQQEAVLEFVGNLAQSVQREESPHQSLAGVKHSGKKEIDLREFGISREQAADLRARLSTFAEDW